MARTKIEILTPTAYNLLRIVNADMVRKFRQRLDVEITTPTLLSRAELIVNEDQLLTQQTTEVQEVFVVD